jgi:methyl-accepting chemotaxis protein
MIDSLSRMIHQIKENADQLVSASSQIAASAEQTSKNSESSATAVEEMTSTMHEMSTNIQNVARNSQRQSASVTETSSSIEQMVASIQRVAENVKRLVSIAEKSKDAVSVGSNSVNRSSTGMNEINTAIQQSAMTIVSLGSRTEEMAKIVEVIDDIAEQTNLLALNAAIEAARAGEQGMGFAVVADEVRKLAERSAKSTREIADLIHSVSNEAQTAVDNMTRSTGIVEQGLVLSKEVIQALEGIKTSVEEVSKYSNEIGAATQEQAGGSDQIGKAMVNLNEVTQEISTATEEQSAGAEQVVKAIEKVREMAQQNASSAVELASSADQLSRQSTGLQGVVAQFALNGHGRGN